MRRLSEPLRLVVTLLLILPLTESIAVRQQCTAPLSKERKTYRHLVVLVHGYLGSDREQEYLGEALAKQSKKLIEEGNKDESSTCDPNHHQLVILNSKANVGLISIDGVASGGKRLAAEITEWIEEQTAGITPSESDDGSESSTVVTFSMVGNSLGGLYGRYALSELDFLRGNSKTKTKNPIVPLVFCTTSSPHLGVSQETIFKLPRWIEPHVATVFRQRTMDDLFGVNNSTVVRDMCENPPAQDDDDHDFLSPLKRFRKRIAVANAYKTDFLVSVSSGAFLSLDSESVHHRQDSSTSSTRLMKDIEHVALQVVTKPTTTTTTESITTESRDDSSNKVETNTGICVDSLDRLGWHKIFIDTRKILPGFMSLPTPELKRQASYTSSELKEHFETFGTLLPIAHPLNMANAKTDLYRKITKSGQPIVDALAELLMSDMVELSEQNH